MTLQLPVVYDPDAWDEDDDLDEAIPESEIRNVRDAVIEVCRRHGTVTAEPLVTRADLMADDDEAYDRNVDYYLPGWLDDDEKRIPVEPHTSAIREAWFSDVAAALRDFPQWTVDLALDEVTSLYLFADRILLTSEWLRGCGSVSSIIALLRRKQASRDERLAAVQELTAAAYRTAVEDNREIQLVAHYPTWSDGTPGKSIWLIHRNMTEDYEFQFDALKFAPFANRLRVYQLHPDGSMSEDPPIDSPGIDLLVEWILSTSDWRPEWFAAPPQHPSGRFGGEVIDSVKFIYIESKTLGCRFEIDSQSATQGCSKCAKRVPETFWHAKDATCALCIADNWLDQHEIPCEGCGQSLSWVYHSPFYGGPFFYCTRCPRRVHVDSYDPVVSAIRDRFAGIDEEHDRLKNQAIQERLAPCPCGGAFEYEAPRRCVYCGAVIPQSTTRRDVWPVDGNAAFEPLEVTEDLWK
ncbi:MAG: hypothetical protein AAF657_15090 [Acidobacteriota bacterium]